jgi:hypothetical protein
MPDDPGDMSIVDNVTRLAQTFNRHTSTFLQNMKNLLNLPSSARGYNTIAVGVDFAVVGADNGQRFVRISIFLMS